MKFFRAAIVIKASGGIHYERVCKKHRLFRLFRLHIIYISLVYHSKPAWILGSYGTLHVKFVNLDDLKTKKLRQVIFRLFQNAMDCFNIDIKNVSSLYS